MNVGVSLDYLDIVFTRTNKVHVRTHAKHTCMTFI